MKRLLLNSLREGGLILYVRHGEATIGRDWPKVDFRNCFTQRNLSEQGRRQAIYYGDILRYFKIPIQHPVSASPFCRTLETAQLAFGSANVKIDLFWVGAQKLNENLPSEERKRVLAHLQSILETKPAREKNKVIIAHSFPAGVGLGQIPNMGTVIIRPKGQGSGYEVVSRLSLSDLGTLES
ncbi:histidine phosphatase family protein [Bacillus thermotolerans]|uniref:Fructose-2,6-bisphosphatase n=1 Tax=Bacillus thermotolerans TaxID=1221996 RepID=A0A0F5HRN6_BACTR|nr:histidine phosphatase family protein [Bacillus thermotolerans]KKB33919.1 Fructose-2,6-bisphosphatase [Bacillus thermotolerans]KKB35680.1 Fructose-2,6-bisphosphatase [Bacillus thermotolerans]